MARIYSDEGRYFFDTQEEPPFIVELDENNFMANVHRKDPMKDRIAITDPRDDMAWSWFRFDQNPEIFEQMVETAYEIGSVLLRDTPFETINGIFDQTHDFTDEDWEGLLDNPA